MPHLSRTPITQRHGLEGIPIRGAESNTVRISMWKRRRMEAGTRLWLETCPLGNFRGHVEHGGKVKLERHVYAVSAKRFCTDSSTILIALGSSDLELCRCDVPALGPLCPSTCRASWPLHLRCQMCSRVRQLASPLRAASSGPIQSNAKICALLTSGPGTRRIWLAMRHGGPRLRTQNPTSYLC